jgi:Fe-S oxidoreductase
MCKYCVERCPTNALPEKVGAKVRVNEIIELVRADLIEKGFARGKVADLLNNLRRTHNPWGSPAERRTSWTQGLPVKVATDNAPKPSSFAAPIHTMRRAKNWPEKL